MDGNQSADTARPLIGVDGIQPPKWVGGAAQVAAAGWWKTVSALPTAVGSVVRLAWAASPRWTLLAAALHVAAGAVTAFGLLATANVLTQLLEQGPTPERVVASLPAIALVVGSFAAKAGLDAAVALAQGVLSPRVEVLARDRLYAVVLDVEAAAFDDADYQELVRQGGIQGVRAFRRSVDGVGDPLASLISLVAALVTVSVFSVWLLPALLAAAAANAWASMRAAKVSYASFLKMIARDRQSWVIGDLITERDAALEVRAFTTQALLLGEYRRVSRVLTAEAVRVARQQTGIQLIGRTISGIGTAIAYLVLGWLLYTEVMPLALAGAAVVAMRTGSTALSNTIHGVNGLYEDSFFIELYEKLLSDSAARRGPVSVGPAPVNPEAIELRDVTYVYPGQDTPAVEAVTLTLRRGEVVALVGENGSGKSTLGKLITGLYRPTTGKVLWDGVDIATAHRDSVHAQISVVSQEPLRWPVTAADNIRIGRLERDGRDGTLWTDSAALSGADELIEALPRKENTVLSRMFEDGQDLSGGQWQRLSVARGAYREAPVLVADEPTAALDARAEARVFGALQSASRDGAGTRTTVLVTHRLANVRHADRILVLEHGRITGDGTHEQLMAAGGPYAELFSLQAGAYR